MYLTSMVICEDATLEDLSSEAIAQARELFAVKNPKLKPDILTWNDATFLNKAKITIKGKITHTAIILLGKAESEHFISPAIVRITWILKDRDGVEKDYAYFGPPLLLNVIKVHQKIRFLTYRYISDGSLFPEEVEAFDPYIIREALNNCIAHQDYSLAARITLVENEENILLFKNHGNFIPGSIENVITSDAPESRYRNPFLVDAMVNLNMIDTIGSGIRKMFNVQQKKFFPLPEYNLENNCVSVSIIGKVLDLKYAQKLAQLPSLSLQQIILLDKVQKRKTLKADEIKSLRAENLIEGRKPNFHISSMLAKQTDQKTDYVNMRGIEDDYVKKTH